MITTEDAIIEAINTIKAAAALPSADKEPARRSPQPAP